jgi:hypothetical protein
MSSILIIVIGEDSTACIYEEELKDLGLDSIIVDTLDKAISILEYQQFDLILLLPDSSDKQKVNDLLGRMRLLKSTYRNTKILVISSFYSIKPDSFDFADALVVRGTGPEGLLVVCELLGIDKQRVWDRVESGMKLLGGRVKVRRKDIKLFLCYAKEDFKQAHLIYQRLNNEAYSPWMDKENIVGGQDWDLEITKAIEQSNFFLACLSRHSVSKEGYVQKELKMGLEVLDRQPSGNIYLIPVRLDDCVVAQRFKKFQWVDLFESNGMEELLKAVDTGCKQRGMI